MDSPFTLVAALPFAGLVLSIVVLSGAAPALWARCYSWIALAWTLTFIVPDLVHRGWRQTGFDIGVLALDQYIPFVLLLGTLYVVAGGVRITGTPRGTPAVNTALLGIGMLLAGLVGTPGASLLMLRPMIHANRHRDRTAHVYVFFILLVANVGGALSPIGNAPLLLGYLQGVPFFWASTHLALPNFTLAAGLLATFFALEHVLRRGVRDERTLFELEKLRIEGGINLVLLVAAVAAIVLPAFWRGSREFSVSGLPWQVSDAASDLALLLIGIASVALTAPAVRRANDFAWGPLVEVAVLFAALFVTLMPVTAMMADGAAGPFRLLYARAFAGGAPDIGLFFWATGILSALLDNAPTYLMFFGLAGHDAARLTGPLATTLAAISAGACYFGGLTYLGNAPNLMVRAVVESHGVPMPSFPRYTLYAAACLIPWLVVVEALYFAKGP
ncbi:MAG TPA: sodium:proton antiporter [Stellaceae bacterium]|nr:sodium:proton antiporter [Stellaceae bacterium]